MIRQASSIEIEQWDKLVGTNPLPDEILQGRVYAEFKTHYGWKPRYFIYEPKTGSYDPQDPAFAKPVAILALTRSVPYFGEIWYLPKGPAVKDWGQLATVLKALKPETHKAFLVKVESEIPKSAAIPDSIKSLGLQKAPFDLQWNSSTTIVDLAPPEEDILASFKQKTRYNIRLSARKGVEAKPVELTRANMRIFFDLLLQTQKRNGFFMRPRDYMESFWQLYSEAGEGQLFFAYYEGEVLAGVFAPFLGKRALYKDGGSTRTHGNVMAPYLLQWEVMRWLKDHGVTSYDLHGMPPGDQAEDSAHPLSGLVRFKSGFNPDLTEYIGVYDWVLDSNKYNRWQKLGERLAVKYEQVKNKNLFY